MCGQPPDAESKMQDLLMRCRSYISCLQTEAQSLKDSGKRQLLLATLSRLKDLHALSTRYLVMYGAAIQGKDGEMDRIWVAEAFAGALTAWQAQNQHTPKTDGAL